MSPRILNLPNNTTWLAPQSSNKKGPASSKTLTNNPQTSKNSCTKPCGLLLTKLRIHLPTHVHTHVRAHPPRTKLNTARKARASTSDPHTAPPMAPTAACCTAPLISFFCASLRSSLSSRDDEMRSMSSGLKFWISRSATAYGCESDSSSMPPPRRRHRHSSVIMACVSCSAGRSLNAAAVSLSPSSSTFMSSATVARAESRSAAAVNVLGILVLNWKYWRTCALGKSRPCSSASSVRQPFSAPSTAAGSAAGTGAGAAGSA
mmetsp:Transcript_32210/g.81846  ORF Transcript_32210/g.81846 Transcript_32210/m.81846 type:complete len:262 (-) Transcript_32210:194-979(-)